MTSSRFGKKTWLSLTVLTACAVGGWWQRGPILSWYYVRQLNSAPADKRELWSKRTVNLGEAATPRLMDGLRDPDAAACSKMQYPLILMAKAWGPADPRTHELLERLRRRFEEFSPAGQENAILAAASALQVEHPKPLPLRLTKSAGEILVAAAKRDDLRAAALQLAAELVDAVDAGQWVDFSRELAERGLRDETSASQVAALRLLMREPMRKNTDLLEMAVPLLRHAEPAVRKSALLVLASERDLVRDEALLHLLHDDNAEVQFLCENALRKRGLGDDDIQLARMISDRAPATRMRVLYHLHRVPDLNHSSLLDLLSRDPSAAVRAAAARAAAEFPSADFTARLREMAATDASETVRQIAQYHLQQRAQRAARD